MGDLDWRPRIWEMRADEHVFSDIVEGREQKTGRAPDPSNKDKDYASMKNGDLIVFAAPAGARHVSRVTSIDHYFSQMGPIGALKAMFSVHDYHIMEPDAANEDDAIENYLAYPGYEERISEHGIYVLGISRHRRWEIYMPPDHFLTFYHGERTVEGRALDIAPEKDYRLMGPGDFALIYDDQNEMWRWVQDVRTYSTPIAMLQSEGMEQLVPGLTDIYKANRLYCSFPGYKERILKYGIAAIHFGGFAETAELKKIGFWSENFK